MDPRIAELIVSRRVAPRPRSAAEVDAELQAFPRIADAIIQTPATALQVCTEVALALCGAGSCGVSVCERTPGGEEVFRWVALAGAMAGHLNGTTPRHFSPCGDCVDAGTPLLLERPERVYQYLSVGVPLHEVLLLPVGEKGGELEGTMWVVSHDPGRRFDAEDERLMRRMTVFTSMALRLAQRSAAAERLAAEKQLAFEELDHRVKNSLQIAADALWLQLRSVTDPAARRAIETARKRILFSGQMHHLRTGGAVDLGELLRGVCGNLVGAGERIGLELHLQEGVSRPASSAALVALIAQELVGNAIKYAFPADRTGTISVVLEAGDGTLSLAIADDGIPLPEAWAAGPPGSSGMRLVREMAQQLGGNLSIDIGGKRFAVTVP